MLQSCNYFCDPKLHSLLYVHVSLVVGAPELDSWDLTSAEQSVRITSLDLLEVLLLKQSRMTFTVFVARAHCWQLFSLVFTRMPMFFS